MTFCDFTVDIHPSRGSMGQHSPFFPVVCLIWSHGPLVLGHVFCTFRYHGNARILVSLCVKFSRGSSSKVLCNYAIKLSEELQLVHSVSFVCSLEALLDEKRSFFSTDLL